MSDPQDSPGNESRDEQSQMMSALFMNYVLSQSNLALMMLGKVPHPHTGEVIHDVESAKLFIDQLEMITVKTKGNLDKDEAQYLAETLTSLRLAFVEAIENPSAPTPPSPSPSAPPPPAAKEQSRDEGESKKRFSKKY